MFPNSIRPTGRVRSVSGKMNQKESRYAEQLALALQAGTILWWKWDCMNLKLAANTYYRTDFLVMTKACELQIHEVKGHLEDDAWVKLKAVAEMYPFELIVVREDKKKYNWTYEVVDGAPIVAAPPSTAGAVRWPK